MVETLFGWSGPVPGGGKVGANLKQSGLDLSSEGEST